MQRKPKEKNDRKEKSLRIEKQSKHSQLTVGKSNERKKTEKIDFRIFKKKIYVLKAL